MLMEMLPLELNRKFNFKLPENSASTIAGLIINTAKRILRQVKVLL